MLQLSKHQAQINGLNVRVENHGRDRVLAVDVKLSFTGSNKLLDSIDPTLREALYRAPATGDQANFIDADQVKENGIEDDLVNVKLPYAAPLDITTKFDAYEATIRGQLKRSKSLDLAEVTLKNLTLQPLDGGSVKITLACACTVESKDLAVLGELFQRQDIRLSLIPPDAQHETDESDEADGEDETDEDGADGVSDSLQGDILDAHDAADAANDEAPDLPSAA